MTNTQLAHRSLTTQGGFRALSAAALVPLLIGIAGAAPASAATSKSVRSASLSSTTCAAAGGIYVSANRTKTCTMLATAVTTALPVISEKSLVTNSWSGGSVRISLVGTSSSRTTVVTTTVRTQVASNGVQETKTVKTSSVVVPVTCAERTETTSSGFYDRTTGAWIEGTATVVDVDMPLTRCEIEGVFAG